MAAGPRPLGTGSSEYDGFGGYLAAATGLQALALLFGLSLPFKAYLATSTLLGVILGPLGWTIAAGVIVVAGYFQKAKLDGEILCQLITALHYRLTRE